MGREEKRILAEIVLGTVLFFAALAGVTYFNWYVLAGLPLLWRMVLMIVTYRGIAAGPALIALIRRDKAETFGFVRGGELRQILLGAAIGIGMSLVLTLPAHLAGFGSWVDNGKRYTLWWQFLYELVYCVGAVGLSEEFVFRGFLYGKLRALSRSEALPVAVSSVFFGLFHFLTGAWIQMIVTALLGVLFCELRLRIRGCTTLSLIFAHGVYDLLITVWASLLL